MVHSPRGRAGAVRERRERMTIDGGRGGLKRQSIRGKVLAQVEEEEVEEERLVRR